MVIALSLLRTIKNLLQACPPIIFLRFSQESIPKSLVKKKITFHKVIQRLLKPCPFYTLKRKNIIGGHAWRNFFIVRSKLEAFAIYVVKQACGHDIMA